ncbi:hypothetical protein F5B22DRAFT_587111 [Xylaria bambusicola]|uniref:uncharacterized protein n=1 Tax=Xylaria bambusicola TaxID=326684 RepID=UPI0020077B33|nr:uncharacterized protein F5B22DRAFT_587111 [Xylaria bambusicola]KAI0526691.1 hypothetical protein F5B22DRAFT_587111 [Xylaria bambusicola]
MISEEPSYYYPIPRPEEDHYLFSSSVCGSVYIEYIYYIYLPSRLPKYDTCRRSLVNLSFVNNTLEHKAYTYATGLTMILALSSGFSNYAVEIYRTESSTHVNLCSTLKTLRLGTLA